MAGEIFKRIINILLDLELTIRFNIVFARERRGIEMNEGEFYPESLFLPITY
jgi:hypothetical protein